MAESGVGAPVGNQNAVKGKRWSNAIDRALAKRSKVDATESLDALAEELLKKCEAGDMAALKELGDRLEGKPGQALTIGNPEGEEFKISKLVREIVRTPNQDG